MMQMTQAQAKQLARATERAEREHVEVTGTGWRWSDNAPVYTVRSSSDPNRWYVVALEVNNRLSCDCPAGKEGRMCKHKAAVRQRIAAERARLRPAGRVA